MQYIDTPLIDRIPFMHTPNTTQINGLSMQFPSLLNFNDHGFADNENTFAGTTGILEVTYQLNYVPLEK